MKIQALVKHAGSDYAVEFDTCHEELEPDAEHGLPLLVAYDFLEFHAWNGDGDPILAAPLRDALRKATYDDERVWATINDAIVDVVGEAEG